MMAVVVGVVVVHFGFLCRFYYRDVIQERWFMILSACVVRSVTNFLCSMRDLRADCAGYPFMAMSLCGVLRGGVFNTGGHRLDRRLCLCG